MNDEPKWFHVIICTYGSWLPGDPRGFRTRNHREHVEGDYKNPPPAGVYDARLARTRKLLKQPPVVFPPEWRPIIGAALRERLEQEGATVISLSVGGQHAHIQAKMPPVLVDHWVGLAKRHVTFTLHERGWSGLVWAKGNNVKPIKDRTHQGNVFGYIGDHIREGAWVWTFRDLQEKARG